MKTEIANSMMTIKSFPGMRVRSADREVGMKTWPHLLHTACVLQRVLRATGVRGERGDQAMRVW